MMVPSLSTSISSPALFKNRENGGDGGVEDNNNNIDDQLEQLQNQANNLGDLQFDEQLDQNEGNQQTFDDLNFGESADNNNNSNFELQDLMSMMKSSGGCDSINSKKSNSNSNSNKEGLNDLFISSINVGTLLDDLDQLSDNHSQASVSSGTNTTSKRGNGSGYDIKTQRSVGTKGGGGSNSSGSSPRSNSLRVYRTFPYRGDHHSYSQQQQQQQQSQQSNDDKLKSFDHGDKESQEKPKPSSTNGIRHSRKYKGLQQLDFLGTMIIDKDNANNNNAPNPINDSQEVPIQQCQQPLTDSINNLEELNIIINNNNNNNVHTTNTTNTNTNTTQWSELIESLGYSSQSGEQKMFGSTLDDSNLDLKDLIVDGITLNQSQSSNSATCETDFSKIENLNQQSSPPPSIDVSFGNNNSSSIGNDLYPDTIEIQQQEGFDENKQNEQIEEDELSKVNAANKFQQNLNLLNTGMGGRVCQADSKKKQLSRTITFSDPSSIYSFFNGSNSSIGGNSDNNNGNEDDAKVPNSSTTSTNTTNTNNNVLNSTSSPIIKMDHQQRVSEQNRTSSKISLSTLFPTLPPFNNSSTTPTLSPSKYYFPLLQPPTESTALIRGFSAKADINKRGLKRAKKPMEMEDEYFAEHPFGGTDESIGMFAIFDGHSGKNCAVAAKQLLPDILQRYITSTKNENGNKPIYDMRGVLLNAFKEVDAQLSKFEYEGATATVVLVWKPVGTNQRFVQSANVGDSTAFLSYGNETLFLSKDHRATDPEEIQRIKNDGITLTEGQTRINGLMVSRALGDHFIKHLNCGLTGEPYVSPPIPITPFHSHLIVASDGLWDVISGHRAMEIIKLQPSEDKMSNSLIQCSLSSVKGKDNVSVIVVSL